MPPAEMWAALYDENLRYDEGQEIDEEEQLDADPTLAPDDESGSDILKSEDDYTPSESKSDITSDEEDERVYPAEDEEVQRSC